MRRNGDAERRRLFDIYTKQLERGGVTPTDIFVCPLCLKGFTRQALDGPNPALSIAHAIPEALGGRLWTLACTDCNNRNGATLESDLAERFEYEEWSRGVGGRKARLSGEFGDIGVVFRRSPGTSDWKLYFVEGQTNPACLAAFDEWATKKRNNPEADIQLSISWSARNRPERINAAIYQSAYLLMFAYFGYDFVFRSQYTALREQIRRPAEPLWPGRVNVLNADDWADLPAQQEGAVMFVREPEPCVATFLRFRPRDGQDRVVAVLLPRPDAASACVPSFERGTMSGSVIPFRPEGVKTHPRFLLKLWRQLGVGGEPQQPGRMG